MPDPVEIIYVEVSAKADGLTAEVKKGVDTAKKEIGTLSDTTKKQEKEFLSLGDIIKGVFALVVVQKFIGALQKVSGLIVNITQQAVALASGYEGVLMTFNRLLGSEEKATEFMDALRVQAAAVGQNFVEMAQAAKSFLPYAEGSKEAFLGIIQAQMGLAAADPMQGMIGAAMALREFLSGTYQSLAMRFELPRDKLRMILKDHKDIEGRMKALNELLVQFGMGWALVEEQATTLPGIMGQIKGVWTEALLALGQPVMQELKEHASDLLTIIIDNKDEIIELARKFGEWIAAGITGIRDLIEKFVELGKSIDTFMTGLRGPTWFEDWIKSVKRLGVLIDVLLVDSLSFVAQTLEYIGTNLQRIATGGALVPLAEYLAGRREARKEAWRSALERWGFARREAPKVEKAPAPEEEAPTPEEGLVLGEKAKKALAAGAAKIEAIFKKFQKRIEKLRRDHAKKMATIDEKEIKDQLKARAKYDKNAEKLQTKFQKQQIKAEKDYHKERIRDQEDFNKQWARLIRDQHQEVLDADWDFRFQEEHLIAEGDTLALRDLRLRYAHEKEVRAREQDDARSDTQTDSQRQEDDRRQAFQDAQAERDTEYRERLLELQTSFGEQLALITENAAEARQKEKQNLVERATDAQQSRDEELAKIGEWLANVKGVSGEELTEISRLWAEIYGEIADAGIAEGLRAHEERMRLLGLEKAQAEALADAYAGMEPTSPYVPGSSGAGGRGGRTGRPGRRAQFGMDEIINRPTLLMVGEGGIPEHVQVTPLGGGGIGMSGRLDINVSVSSAGAMSPEAESAMIVAVAGAIKTAVQTKMEAGV